jgi:Zn-dependent peptidase ImmA (M78 family)
MPIQIDRMELGDEANPKKLAAAVLAQIPEVTFPIPVENIARGCGITDIAVMTTQGFEGALITNDTKMEGVILVNKRNDPHRRRYTVGHELGHLLNPWHLPTPDGFHCTSQHMLHADASGAADRWKMEAQANEFAAELLMPPEAFKQQFRRVGGEVSIQAVIKLSNEFEVSKLAAARRIISLRKECALILSHEGVIKQIYRSEDFPFITLKPGLGVPKDTITKRYRGEPSTYSEIEETDPGSWTTTATKRGLQFLEQVLAQSTGYRLTLLSLDESECGDDDDEEVRQRSEWNPTLGKSRRK